jgi:hypothetical protein
MDELEKAIARVETTRDILREVINDMTLSCDELDKYIKFLRDPFRMMMSEDIGKEIEEMGNKAQLYALMAANKMTALTQYMEVDKEGEEDERSK